MSATSSGYSGEGRGVSISSYSVSGNKCSVTLTHANRTDHAVAIGVTVSVYGY